jgi:hypothetical protein
MNLIKIVTPENWHLHTMEDYVGEVQELVAERAALSAEVERLKAENAWIPVRERLPETNPSCSEDVEVAYRCVDDDGIPFGQCYYRMVTKYWKEYGWSFRWSGGKSTSFEDWGYKVYFWHNLTVLPKVDTP